jgi:Bacterial cellulose synthase subunit
MTLTLTLTKTKRLLALTLTGLIALQAATPQQATAISQSETMNLGALGLGTLKLGAKAPATEVTAALPAAWSGAKASVRLVLSSQHVRPGQTLAVLVDGTQQTTTALRAGSQDVSFTTGTLPGGTVRFELKQAGPAATVTVEPASQVSLTSTGAAPLPQLSSLPGSLLATKAAATTPLTVALPPVRSATVLRAAMIAAGAVAKADSPEGIKVVAALDSSPTQLAATPGPVLVIDQRPGRGALSLAFLPSGQLELTVAGSGQSLLNAARLLSSPWIRSLNGEHADVPDGVGSSLATPAGVPTQETLAPARAQGRGPLSVSSSFVAPVQRVIAHGKATLRLGLDYNAPAGGRIAVTLNGNTLGAYQAASQGSAVHVLSFKLSSNWSEAGNLLPGYYLQPGANVVTVKLTPPRSARRGPSSQLALTTDSGLALSSVARPVTEQLGLWPFPLYGQHGWSRTTIVLAHTPTPATISALLAVMANTERVTGVPADPAVTFRAPDAQQRAGNLFVIGNPTVLAALPYSGPLDPGVLAESHILYGGVAAMAIGPQALSVVGYGYQPGLINARAVLVTPTGHVVTVVAAPPVNGFAAPSRPWLAPAALIALFVLGWLALQVRRARRRLSDLPDLKSQSNRTPVAS